MQHDCQTAEVKMQNEQDAVEIKAQNAEQEAEVIKLLRANGKRISWLNFMRQRTSIKNDSVQREN